MVGIGVFGGRMSARRQAERADQKNGLRAKFGGNLQATLVWFVNRQSTLGVTSEQLTGPLGSILTGGAGARRRKADDVGIQQAAEDGTWLTGRALF
jgi:hypothetical protein